MQKRPRANTPARGGALKSIAAKCRPGAVRTDDKRVVIW
jgi:hypothetical protein